MRLSVKLLHLVVLVSVILLLPSSGYATGGQWVKYSGNPVLVPTPGSWDNDYVVSPRVLFNDTTYRMWYDGGNSGVGAIGYANSTDGLTWNTYPNPVLSPGGPGAWDSGTVTVGSVIWNGTAFLMWYGGSNTTISGGEIGLAMSKDGISWTKYSENPVLRRAIFSLDQSYMASPYVIKLSTEYWMWYTGKNTTYPEPNSVSRILAATSYDGITWTKAPSPAITPSSNSTAWDSGSVYSASVIFDGTNFGLWYTGTNQSYMSPQIGFASSPGGGNWTRSALNPILGPGMPGSWDSAGVEQPSAIVGGSGFMLYYDGFSPNTGGRIGVAIGPHNFVIPEFSAPTLNLLFGAVISTTVCFAAIKRRHDH